MKIIVGLGNPGRKFEGTRHNIGFMVVDKIIKNLKLKVKSYSLKFKINKKFKAKILDLKSYNLDLILVKPQTFMNKSGLAVKKILQYNNMTIEQYNNLYIIHDDLDIPLGKYKIQFGRGAAGHKGVESVIKELGTKNFWRVRIGIGRDIKILRNLEIKGNNFVLEKFSKREREIIDKVIGEVIKDLERKLF